MLTNELERGKSGEFGPLFYRKRRGGSEEGVGGPTPTRGVWFRVSGFASTDLWDLIMEFCLVWQSNFDKSITI